MVWIAGGSTLLGSEDSYPEERPIRRVEVSGFWIDRSEVTNAQFARFVEATGYTTIAERRRAPEDHPGSPPDLLVPGAVVFVPPTAVGSGRLTQWWQYVPGANWRQPEGPGSSIAGRANHPVVNVAYEDALAYARWRGRDLPTEAQFEFAARGGLDGMTYAWGNELSPGGKRLANTWQGFFPVQDTGEDGFKGTAPVGCFPPNGYGLHDMIGNVWEWTTDIYTENAEQTPAADHTVSAPRVIKGGSYLCAANFCGRYRPSARQPGEFDLGAAHIGFRTVRTPSH